jgi:hypothetical protein
MAVQPLGADRIIPEEIDISLAAEVRRFHVELGLDVALGERRGPLVDAQLQLAADATPAAPTGGTR